MVFPRPQASGLLAQLQGAATDAKSPAAREGAFLAYAGMVDGAPRATEPFLVYELDNILDKCSDKVCTGRCGALDAVCRSVAVPAKVLPPGRVRAPRTHRWRCCLSWVAMERAEESTPRPASDSNGPPTCGPAAYHLPTNPALPRRAQPSWGLVGSY